VTAEPRLELVEAEAWASLTEAAGLPVLRVGRAVCIAAPVAPRNTLLNRVTGLGVADPVGDDDLAEIDAFYRTHGVPQYVVAFAPAAGPDLAGRLRERGFETGHAWMKFRRGAGAPPSTSTALRLEANAPGEHFAAVIGAVSGMPPDVAQFFSPLSGQEGWHCFVGYDGDEPVACAALFAHDGVGWLGAAGTLPDQRGKGAQSALLAVRIALARELGLDVQTTETGEQRADIPNVSYRNILRAGFDEAYLRPNLLSPPADG
jgi:GNAT superfamily N-acetyltransferase